MTPNYQIEIEIASVNRKQIDLAINLPKAFQNLEIHLRKHITAAVSRGRLNVGVKIQSVENEGEVTLNEAKVQAVYTQLKAFSEKLDGAMQPTWSDVLKFPDLLEVKKTEVDHTKALEELMPVLEEAMGQLIKMRQDEGEHLRKDILSRIELLKANKIEIAALAPDRITHHQEQLKQRLKTLELEIDLNDERLLKELALFADRCDITEEITRLDSHFHLFETTMNKAEPVGRTLDFLTQEINREFNTIASKSHHAELSQIVVQSKTELEKIREQIQNVE